MFHLCFSYITPPHPLPNSIAFPLFFPTHVSLIFPFSLLLLLVYTHTHTPLSSPLSPLWSFLICSCFPTLSPLRSTHSPYVYSLSLSLSLSLPLSLHIILHNPCFPLPLNAPFNISFLFTSYILNSLYPSYPSFYNIISFSLYQNLPLITLKPIKSFSFFSKSSPFQ